ncbi:nuclear transport factor 2 family protein [Haladaptatus sp. DFWS20]|uniref:nuclear transport factor 2 family protein n=1 Tax=Haladaptatus sp. DFWS20 TaxID=3403467 RepID=UPI003EBD7F02
MAKTSVKSNAQIVRENYAAFNQGDVEAVMATMADDIEWIEPEGTPYGGVYRTPEAVLENAFGPVMEDIEAFRIDTDRFIDGGDTIVVLGTFHGTSKESDKRLDVPFAHICDLEDGKISRFVNHTNTLLWQQTVEA